MNYIHLNNGFLQKQGRVKRLKEQDSVLVFAGMFIPEVRQLPLRKYTK